MLNPVLLWFLPLAIVPLLLHLVTLRRLRTVELSTFRFLVDSYVQQYGRMRVLEYLVMLLRATFIAACVVTLTRPIIERYPGLFSGQGGGEITIVVDASPSMALRTNLTTSLRRAKDAARTIVGLVDDNIRVSVIRAGRKPQRLTSRFAKQRQAILDQIDSLKTGIAAGSMAAALEQIFQSDSARARKVFLISDGNQNAWAGLENHAVLERFGANTQILIVNVGPNERVANVTLSGQLRPSLHTVVHLPVQLTSTVVNNSPDKSVNTVVSVVVDDRQVKRLNVSLSPGQRISRTVSVTPTHPGIVRGRLELPSDAFPLDDTFLFCLNVEPHLKVLLVTDQNTSTSMHGPQHYIRAVLESPRHAAQQSSHSEQQIASTLKLTTATNHLLTQAMLEAADVVVLADAGLDAPRLELLRKHVELGGALMILPGPNVNAQDYNTYLLSTPAVGGQVPTVTASLDAAVGDVNDESKFVPIATVDLTHPVFSAFDEPDAEYFSTVRLYRYFPIRLRHPTQTAPDGNNTLGQLPPPRTITLMQLPDGTPILVEICLGAGTILLSSVSASAEWSNLPLTGEFVTMMLRALVYLHRRPLATALTTVRPHELAPIRLTDRWANASVQAFDPTERSHAVTLSRSGRHLVGAMAKTDRKGYYRFSVLPRTPGAPERVEVGFAVNIDTQQATLHMFDEKRLRALLTLPDVAPQVKVHYACGAPGDQVLLEQLEHKREIWRDLMAAAFVVILIEFLLATLPPGRDAPRLAAGLAGAATANDGWARRLRGYVDRMQREVSTPSPLNEMHHHGRRDGQQ